jgi:glycerol transport system ATP-binding protein
VTPYHELKLGIRPEFVEVLEADSPLLSNLAKSDKGADTLLESCENCFKCEVVTVSDLGTYKIVSLKLGNTEFKARLPEEQSVPSGSVYVRFPGNWLKVYADEYLVD